MNGYKRGYTGKKTAVGRLTGGKQGVWVVRWWWYTTDVRDLWRNCC
jgi:hypothetical protein